MGWWTSNNLRMIQFNMMQEDAAVPASRLVETLRACHANAVMMGAGGIVAMYPTALPFHYRSPYLGEGDLLGDMVKLCHENGIRVIARFDFSKVHESIALQHPDWHYRDANGEIVNYHGVVHECLCGDYTWNRSLDILRECLTRYPVDGIYINMFGFQARRDYDGVDHGLCQCANCRARFERDTGRPYPRAVTPENRELVAGWMRAVTREMTQRAVDTVKAVSPDISVCTHTEEAIVNMKHTESNTALRRPLPFWDYASFENVRMTNDQHEEIVAANCCINAADIAWRFMGISKHLLAARLWQQVAAGGQPEWCMVGTPDRYPETANDETVRRVFAFHEAHEGILSRLRSLARIALVRINEAFPPDDGTMDEFRGILRMLKEGHYLFDVLTQDHLAKRAKDYDLIILPDVDVPWDEVPKDVNLLVTGTRYRRDPRALRELADAAYVSTDEETAGAYLLCEDKAAFPRIPERNWILMNGAFDRLDAPDGLLPYMPAGVYGPVEIAGGVFPSGYYAALRKRVGEKTRMLLPFCPGRLYHRYGFMEHRDLVLDLIDQMLGRPEVRFEAPDRLDCYCDACPGGRLVQLVNLSGQSGVTCHAPIPMRGVRVTMPAEGATRAVDLVTGRELPVTLGGGELALECPEIGEYGCFWIPDDA